MSAEAVTCDTLIPKQDHCQIGIEKPALAFDWSTGQNSCWIEGQSIAITASRQFQAALSAVCDRTYLWRLRLDNKLINSRELTSPHSSLSFRICRDSSSRDDHATLAP